MSSMGFGELPAGYRRVVDASGTRINRWWWWATHFASKNRFTSRVVHHMGMVEGGGQVVPGRAIVALTLGLARIAVEAYRLRRRRRAVLAGFGRVPQNLELSADLVVKSFTYRRSVEGKGPYIDPFFGRLPLSASACSRVLVVTEIIGECRYAARRLGKLQGVCVVPVDSFVNGRDILWAAVTAARAAVILATSSLDRHLPAAARRAFATDSPQISVTQLVMYRAMRRLGAITRPKHYVQTYENNPWEKMAIRALREVSPNTRILGYQHAAVPQASLNMFLSAWEVRRMPLPDVIITTGAAPAELIRRHSAPGGPPIQQGCALRYEYLAGIEPVSPAARGRRVLVALEGVPEAIGLAQVSLSAAKRDTRLQVVLRFHPALPYEAMAHRLPPQTEWPAGVRVSQAASMVDDLRSADACFYWGTTVSIEAQAMGLPVIHYDTGAPLSFDPLFESLAFHWVARTATDLVAAIDEIAGLGDEEYVRRRNEAIAYVRSYFAPVTESCLARFLPPDPTDTGAERRLRILFLDFDGVIVESNRIKDEGFEVIYSRYPEHYDALMKAHRANDHSSRQEKFLQAARDIVGADDWQALGTAMVEEYTDYTTSRVIACPEVAGARALLDDLHGRVPLVLLSATPDEQVQEILTARDLAHYFDEAYGNPLDKAARMREILSTRGIPHREALFVGDSPDDFGAARKADVAFVGRRSDKVLPEDVPQVFADLAGVHEHILRRWTIEPPDTSKGTQWKRKR